MKLSQIFTSILIIIFFCINFSFAFGDDVPAWLKQAASVTPPTYEKDVPAVVLLDEQQLTLDNDGKLVTVENYAVKILLREGRKSAVARAFYLMSAGKVKEINGWLIRPDGSSKKYDKNSVLDRIADPDDIYNEGRIKIIDGSDDVDAGYVFGYTIVTEDKPLFYQDVWDFQGKLPVLSSRYTLNLPTNWKASSITFNHSKVEPTVNGTNYTWELNNLDPIRLEPLSPSIQNIAPRIAVNFAPDGNAQSVNKAFTDWMDVSRWAKEMYDPQVVIDDAVAGKAQELTANATTELDKIKAIGTFVQNLQYISIDIGVAYGNGYRPRPSNVVLNRGYGDCKDKANLMRAMLKALKIEAYPIAIYSGDPTFVREEWASPKQFNHCIIAIHVSDSTQAATIINHPKLGRLLIFDATDAYTPVGDLPDYLQGSFALIMAGDNGGLAKMPTTPPETNVLERKAEVTLTSDGGISGEIHERALGQRSTSFRQEFRGMPISDYNKAIEGWLTRGATGAKLIKITPKDFHNEALFTLDVEFSAPTYGQLMQGRLLVFKPVIVGRRDGIFLTEASRKYPVLLDSNTLSETVVFSLPQGFTVDEMPDAVKLETPFGKYSTNYEVKDGKLTFTRSLKMNTSTIPVEKYDTVRDFYKQILAAEQSPVVLLKK